MNIFVAKLSSDTTSEDLQQLFSNYGEVASAKVIMDKETGESKRFGFVEMNDEDSGNNAVQNLNESEFQGRTIVVQKAKPRESNNNNRRGGGGGDRRRSFNNNYNRNNDNRGDSSY